MEPTLGGALTEATILAVGTGFETRAGRGAVLETRSVLSVEFGAGMGRRRGLTALGVTKSSPPVFKAAHWLEEPTSRDFLQEIHSSWEQSAMTRFDMKEKLFAWEKLEKNEKKNNKKKC